MQLEQARAELTDVAAQRSALETAENKTAADAAFADAVAERAKWAERCDETFTDGVDCVRQLVAAHERVQQLARETGRRVPHRLMIMGVSTAFTSGGSVEFMRPLNFSFEVGVAEAARGKKKSFSDLVREDV